MTFKEEIRVLRARIAKAEIERDTWRSSGMRERYLAAYCEVEALELALDGLRQHGLRALAKAEIEPSAPAAGAAEDTQRMMAELSVSYDGRYYHYDRYRYDRLADAVDYARLQRSRLPRDKTVRTVPAAEEVVERPDESQRKLMAELDITLRAGIYHLGEYRYDRLGDAVNYARLQRSRARRGS